VIWLTVDMLSEYAGQVLAILQPAVQQLIAGHPTTEISDMLSSTAATLPHESHVVPSGCGCIRNAPISCWARSEPVDAGGQLELLDTPGLLKCNNLDAAASSLHVLACDLKHIGKCTQLLSATSTDGVVMIVSAQVSGATERRRSLALQVLLAQLGCQSKYDYVGRVCAPTDIHTAVAATQGPKLLWLDLSSDEQLAPTLQAVSQACGAGSGTHLILTCDDDADEEALDSLADAMAVFEELEIREQPEPRDVHADDLHEEFILFSHFESRTGNSLASRCLLDVFDVTGLVQQLRKLLKQHCGTAVPIASVYRAGDPSAVCIRLCVSDVGFLHCLRDSLLAGTFVVDVEAALTKPAVQHLSLPWGEDGPASFVTTISVDKSYFAERYEASILNLSKLTPHQRQKLQECEETGGANIHIQAPAGAGKTFVPPPRSECFDSESPWID
jgi:hypothetical protein